MQEPDSRPGFYYVTVINDDGRSARARGPWTDHASALASVSRCAQEASDVDPMLWFLAWGTARSETDLGPGALGPAYQPINQPEQETTPCANR